MLNRVLQPAALAFILAIAATPSHAQTWAELYASGQAVAPRLRTAPVPVPRNSVIGLIQRSAQRHGAPVRLAVAVSQVESRHRCNAVGRSGERGPIQILPATARGLGYRGSASGLTNCAEGLEMGHAPSCYRLAQVRHTHRCCPSPQSRPCLVVQRSIVLCRPRHGRHASRVIR